MVEYKFKENELIHCETKEEAKAILKMADDQGLGWRNEDSYTGVLEWDKYKKETVYNIMSGGYGNTYFYRWQYPEKKIIKAKEILKDMNKETEFDKLPKWVQERMLECQEEQGNNRNPDVFRGCITTSGGYGFNWGLTKEGYGVWYDAIRKGDYSGLKTPKNFNLPEKWCINREANPEVIGKWFDRNANTGFSRSYVEYPDCYNFLNYPKYSTHACASEEPREGYEEITFDQFKKYVLKENKMEEQKEIVGYKLIKPEYEKAVINITNTINTNWEGFIKGWFRKDDNRCIRYQECVKKLKEVEVLDLWFEPIYEKEFKVGDIVVVVGKTPSSLNRMGLVETVKEINSTNGHFRLGKQMSSTWERLENLRKATPEEIEEYNNPKLPIINGYEGKIKDNLIVYGNNCAKLPVRWFKKGGNRYIKSMILSSGVEINEEDMDQIRKVVESKQHTHGKT